MSAELVFGRVLLSNRYDAIVVGAGLGGLTAAAALATSGLHVLVLERSGHAGGTAATYARDGFRFPMGPLGFSNPGLVERTLRGVGAGPPTELRRIDFGLRAFGLDRKLSEPLDRLADSLAGDFPADRDGILRFFGDVGMIAGELKDARSEAREPRLRDSHLSSAGDYLAGLVSDRRLRRILGSIGTNEPFFSIPMLAAMWDLFCDIGIFRPACGMDAIWRSAVGTSKSGVAGDSSSFSSCDDAAGSFEIRLGCAVERISVARGRAIGVVLRGDELVAAGSVVCNADFKTTFLSLLGAEDQPPEWRRAVAEAPLSPSGFHLSLGVDAARVDLSAFTGSRLIYRSDPGLDGDGPAALDWGCPEIEPRDLARQELEVDLFSADEPGAAPDGAAVVLIRAAADFAHFARFRPFPGGREPGYGDYKARLARALVSEVSRLLPGLADAARVTEVATPLTYEERAGRSNGAIAGWSQGFRGNGDYVVRELIRTPVAGLYMAGHQAYSWMMLGGIPTAVESGARAARAVLRGDGPETGVTIPSA